jgi:hydroxymethylpyrimidine pyrophosphatase-like HAD family hydrolase/energy-coupling factor transporter ATP-binding protein EcfA2
MRFAAVAIDYDGTLAENGTVRPSTVAALERLIASGRKLILVTGRILREVLSIFPQADLCARIIAENGAVLYRPATREQRLLAEPASRPLIEALQLKGVIPLDVGDSIISTVRPHEVSVLEAIRDLGLEHHVVFNRESVMVLSPGVTKASGLKSALDELQLSPHNVVGIGDSENDHALLQVSELGVAVGNAVPTLRAAADWVTKEDNGNGTAELLCALVDDDLSDQSARLYRHHVLLGSSADGADIAMSPIGENLLIAGTSGSGKSTLAHGILERLIDRSYQVCVIDPEGDYESIEKTVVFGNAQRGPTIPEILTALDNPAAQVIVNLVGIPLEDRPLFFLDLLPHLQERRSQSGRPHRILVDEAHHLMPQNWQPASDIVGDMTGMLFVTVHPDQVSPVVFQAIDTVIALGDKPYGTLESVADRKGGTISLAHPLGLKTGEAIIWRPKTRVPPTPFLMAFSRMERRRHRRKYAEGELPPERSFYFRGPEGKLNLRAQNLIVFRQLADGIDDATWLHHLHQGDYSRWMETAIKDPSLARMVQQVEKERLSLSAGESRQRIANAIAERYTLPATGI